MSWQTYVDSNLVGTGKIARAAILGQQGGVWAISSGYNLSPEEQSAVIKAFSDPAATQANGVRLGGQKFFTLQADDVHVYGKKQQDGVIMIRTTQAILVAEYAAPTQPGEATKVVEQLGDYLKGVGY